MSNGFIQLRPCRSDVSCETKTPLENKKHHLNVMLGSDYTISACFWHDPFDVGCRGDS